MSLAVLGDSSGAPRDAVLGPVAHLQLLWPTPPSSLPMLSPPGPFRPSVDLDVDLVFRSTLSGDDVSGSAAVRPAGPLGSWLDMGSQAGGYGEQR